jgi:hypothetical protein
MNGFLLPNSRPTAWSTVQEGDLDAGLLATPLGHRSLIERPFSSTYADIT